MSPARIAVVGAGHMGRLHAAKVAALARSEGRVALAGVADLDPDRARQVAEPLGAPAVAGHGELLDRADALVVAVPTVEHGRVVRDALAAGLDVLVEKPIAATPEEAEELIALARDRGRVLQVGHLEWFNAAMRTVHASIRRPRFVEAHRMGPFPDRSTDVDVVRDLMIHDLDIVQRLVEAEPERVEAIGVPVISDRVDIANARLRFPGGCVANFTASRVSPTPMRKIRFFQPDGYFSLDFLEQSVVIARRVAGDDGEKRLDIQKLAIDPEDALLGQLRSFVEAMETRKVLAGDATAAVSALRTALRVIEAMPPFEELE